MIIKYIISSLFIVFFGLCNAQELVLKKGAIMEDLIVADSIPESISLYLPTQFDNTSTWPVVFVFDLQGKGRQALAMFKEAADKEGYILASSNQISDTISISDNALIASRMIAWVYKFLPIQANRSYTAGFSTGAKMAATIATVIPRINGLIMIGSSLSNAEVLYKRNNFRFVGVVGNEDYNLLDLQKTLRLLNSNKYPNHFLVFDGKHTWPPSSELVWVLRYLTMDAMAKGNHALDKTLVNQWYREELKVINKMMEEGLAVRAIDRITQAISTYRLHLATDSLESVKKDFRKDKLYRSQRRDKASARFTESLIREDYAYYLDEDIITANFNNLGWWAYQMSELTKYKESENKEEVHMAVRLRGYLNALIEDHIDIILEAEILDFEALNFTWMLKTITAPEEYEYYLKIIAENSRTEDFGTALFYLEELLKNGYRDKESLYELENTALLRITPEFNTIISKYFSDPRYEPVKQ